MKEGGEERGRRGDREERGKGRRAQGVEGTREELEIGEEKGLN